MKNPTPPKGFSTLELMLALLIMSSALAGIVLVTLGIPQSLADGHEAEIALNDAQALLDKEMRIGTVSFSSVAPIASSTAGIYTTALSVTSLPDGLVKKLTSTASWTNERGQTNTLQLNALVTDFADAGANSCSAVLADDWAHPFVSTLAMAPGSLLPLGSSLVAHPISAASTGTSTLAVAIASTVGKMDPTLFLFDISSSTNPIYLGSLDNASSTKAGFAALTQNGSFLYGANAYPANFGTCAVGSTCSQLQIIDAGNPQNPAVIEDFQLATATAPFAIGSGIQSAGKSIFYANGLVYLGLQKTGSAQGEEFNIIDVQNPEAPVWLGGFSIGRTINQIQVLNGYAYLATDDPARELVILDVHDPANITLAGTYDAPGNSTFGFGEAVSVASTTLALGRSYIFNEPEFTVLDVASATTPSVLSSSTPNALMGTADVESILLRSFLAFVLTNSSLEFWDISDPTHPVSYAPSVSLANGSTIAGTSALTCRNNTLYIASNDTSHAGYLTVVTGS